MNISWVQPIEIEDLLIADAYRDEYISNDRCVRNSGFEIQPLGNLCDDIYRGNTPPHKENTHWNVQTPKIVKTVNIRPNLCDMSSVFDLEPEVYAELPKFQLSTNDIAITIMGATPDILGRAWAYQSWIGKACFSDAVAAIKNLVGRVDREYLASYLNSHFGHQSIMRWSGSSTREYITNTALKRIPIPIPDPKIQAYIGDKVRLAEKCREEANRLHRKCLHIANELLSLGNTHQEQRGYGNFVTPSLLDDRLDVNYYAPRALFALEKFRRGEENRLFTMRSLEEISSHLMDFQAFSIYNSVEFSEEPRAGWMEFLRVQDLEPLYIGMDKVIWTSPQSHQLMPKSVVKPGDLLLTIIGTLGIAAVWPEDSHECNSNQCIAKITVKPEYDPYYLAFILNMPEMQAIVHREATGTVQKGLTLGRTRKLKVPIPDKDVMVAIGTLAKQYSKLRIQSKALIDDALKDVGNLIDGKFDLRNPLSGQVEPPSWMTITRTLGLSSDA